MHWIFKKMLRKFPDYYKTRNNKYLAKEIIIVAPLEITFFQVRQLLIQDDNGYLLCFGEEV